MSFIEIDGGWLVQCDRECDGLLTYPPRPDRTGHHIEMGGDVTLPTPVLDTATLHLMELRGWVALPGEMVCPRCLDDEIDAVLTDLLTEGGGHQ